LEKGGGGPFQLQKGWGWKKTPWAAPPHGAGGNAVFLGAAQGRKTKTVSVAGGRVSATAWAGGATMISRIEMGEKGDMDMGQRGGRVNPGGNRA